MLKAQRQVTRLRRMVPPGIFQAIEVRHQHRQPIRDLRNPLVDPSRRRHRVLIQENADRIAAWHTTHTTQPPAATSAR